MAEAPRHPDARRAGPAGRPRRHGAVRLLASPAAERDDVRRRVACAWADSIALRGYHGTTVRHVLERSGLSRRTFYDHFGDKESAFIAIHADALAALTARLDLATRAEPDWSRRVAVGLAATLRAAACRPREAQLLVGDPFAAGPRPGYCTDLLVARFAPALAAGRSPTDGPSPPPSLERSLIGSVIEIVGSRVRSGSADTLPALGGSLTEFVLTPYLGPEEAKQVAVDSSGEVARSR